MIRHSDYNDGLLKNSMGTKDPSFFATRGQSVFSPPTNTTETNSQYDCPGKSPVPPRRADIHPKQQDCFSMVFGISSRGVSVFSIVIIASAHIDSIRSICNEVTALLSHYSCFCHFSVLPKDDYSFVLDNTYCDLCIVSSGLLSEISFFYPDIIFSCMEIPPSEVRLLLCRHS